MALQSESVSRDTEGEAAETGAPVHAARHSRRLTDKVLAAFHQACDLADYEVAEKLLHVLESMTTRRAMPEDGNRRKNIQGLVAAHERLWHLKHPTAS